MLSVEMKLQRQTAYKYKERTRYKYVVVIPNETVEELGWKEGEELNSKVSGDSLVIARKE